MSRAASACRAAAHAGSWYPADSATLTSMLDDLLAREAREGDSAAAGRAPPAAAAAAATHRVKAVICPHAGYAYSAPVAAVAYAAALAGMPPSVDRIFLLGPSHHVFLPKPAVSACAVIDTPCGKLTVDTDTAAELVASGVFAWLDKSADEEEHSLEMQFPFLARILAKRPPPPPPPAAGSGGVKVVPILIGGMNKSTRRTVADKLAAFFVQDNCAFIFSTDFCHWGARFEYQPVDKEVVARGGSIADGIEAMDRRGIALLEAQDADGFDKYLEETENTICGRYPLSLLLALQQATAKRVPTHTRFVAYAQSSRVATRRDSSVSYAAGVVSV